MLNKARALAITSDLPALEKALFGLFGWLALAGLLLSYAMINPDLAETIFNMLGFKQEELKKEEKNEDTSQN